MVNPDPRMINECSKTQAVDRLKIFSSVPQQFFPEKERKDILSLSKTESQLRRIFFRLAKT
jgi:hypothetical protein